MGSTALAANKCFGLVDRRHKRNLAAAEEAAVAYWCQSRSLWVFVGFCVVCEIGLQKGS